MIREGQVLSILREVAKLRSEGVVFESRPINSTSAAWQREESLASLSLDREYRRARPAIELLTGQTGPVDDWPIQPGEIVQESQYGIAIQMQNEGIKFQYTGKKTLRENGDATEWEDGQFRFNSTVSVYRRKPVVTFFSTISPGEIVTRENAFEVVYLRRHGVQFEYRETGMNHWHTLMTSLGSTLRLNLFEYRRSALPPVAWEIPITRDIAIAPGEQFLASSEFKVQIARKMSEIGYLFQFFEPISSTWIVTDRLEGAHRFRRVTSEPFAPLQVLSTPEEHRLGSLLIGRGLAEFECATPGLENWNRAVSPMTPCRSLIFRRRASE